MVEHATTTAIKRTRRRLGRAALIGSALFVGLNVLTLPSSAQTNDPLPEVEPGVEGSADSEQSPTNDPRFQCQLFNGEYTVMYLPENQPGSAYAWATPGQMGGGWTAERRCFTISERLEAYRPEGLAELQVGTENGYDIVCATTEQVPGLCKIVLTVPPGQNPVITRDRVFEILALADGGSDTASVNTFAAGDNGDLLSQIGDIINGFPMPDTLSRSSSRDTGINLKPFLSPADGGSGAALDQPANTGRSLNPDNFR